MPGNHSLLAFDTATGRVRFRYLYSGHNITIRDEGEAGIRVDFHQGPMSGKFVVLEHDTGKELRRGEQIVLKDWFVYSDFCDGTRALASQEIRGDPRHGPSLDSKVILYDVQNQKILAELSKGGMSHSSVLSLDRRRLAFRTDGMELHIIDTDDGRRLRSLPLNLLKVWDRSNQPVWSRDGRAVYLWRSHDGAMELVALDLESGEVRVLATKKMKVVCSSPVVSPDGGYVAYQLDDDFKNQHGYWRILRLSDLSEAHVIDLRPTATNAAFSPDSQSFWLLSECGLARFDLQTEKLDPLSTDPLSPTEALAFSTDGTKLYGVAGAQVITWDLSTGQEIAGRTGFDDYFRTRSHMRCINISPDGRRTIWAGNSHVHALVDSHEVSKFYASNTQRYHDYDLSPDHQLIVHNAYSGELQVGDLWRGQMVRELLPKITPQRSRENYLITLAPDNRTLALVHRDHRNSSEKDEVEVELWDIQQGRKMGAVIQVGGSQMQMDFTPDSRELQIMHRGEMSVWRVSDQTLVRRRKSFRVPYQRWTTNNRHWWLADSYSYRRDIKRQLELVDIHTGTLARTWDISGLQNGRITAAAFSQDNRLMAIAGHETAASVYRFYELRPEAMGLKQSSDAQLVDVLGSEDAALGFDAMCELIRRGDECLPALQSAVNHKPLSPQEVTALIEKLSAADFATREAATQKVLRDSDDFVSLLQQSLKQGGSSEKLARISSVLSKIRENSISRRRLTTYRVVEVLEAIGSTETRNLLEQLSQGDERLDATHEARAAMSR